MNQKTNSLINSITSEFGITVCYIDIARLMAEVVPEIEIENYTVKRGVKFDQEHFIMRFLSQDEIDRVNSYKSFKKQLEWIAGRFLVKNMAQDIVDAKKDIDYYSDHERGLQEITISYKEEGAPFLEDYPSSAISISHSGELAAAAISTVYSRIGLDIERSSYHPDLSFMRVAFTQREIESVDEDRNNVMKLWTAKEAFLKYLGRGFHEKLHNVEVLYGELFYRGEKQNLILRSFEIYEGYILSLIY